MNEHLNGDLKKNGPDFVFTLKQLTGKAGYKTIEKTIIKVMDYYGIIVRYEHPDYVADDYSTDPNISSDLSFTLQNSEWDSISDLKVRVMPINDDGTETQDLIPYFRERLAYYKDKEGIAHSEIEKFTKQWEEQKNIIIPSAEPKHTKAKDFKPKVIKGDIILSLK